MAIMCFGRGVGKLAVGYDVDRHSNCNGNLAAWCCLAAAMPSAFRDIRSEVAFGDVNR